MKVSLSNELLDMGDISSTSYVHPSLNPYFNERSGQEHYRLLIYLGFCFNGITISDIGTYRAGSAIALGQNGKNKVFSVDIEHGKEDVLMDNVEFYLGDFHTDQKIQSVLLKSKVIFLDIDHLYTNEIWVYNFLKNNKWTGLLICDDIHMNDEMKKFWKEVDLPTIDLTQYGHVTGTGCVFFGNTDIEFDLR